MKRNRLLLLLFALIFLATSFIGVTYSAWIMTSSKNTEQNVSPVVPTWNFVPDSALIDHISGLKNLTKSSETEILSPNASDTDAVRFTNTNGTSGGDHSFVVALDREYKVGEIQNYKIEFDYYHSKKRSTGKGYPRVQLTYQGSGKGNNHPSNYVDTVGNTDPFIATDIDENWWHLEYFVSSLCPTMTDHGDSGISVNQKIDGVKITDGRVYDFEENTAAYFVLDNIRFNSSTASRLGLFNGTSSVALAKEYFWLKVCWAGELKSVNFTFSDDTIAEYAPSDKSPFYFRVLKKGTVTVTATLVLGDNNQVLSISKVITVT